MRASPEGARRRDAPSKSARCAPRSLRLRFLGQPPGGFTLIEVLVALFVFAVAMVALVQAGTHRADNLGYLRDRTLASWIASDRITAIRLDPEGAATGSRDGELEMAGRTWSWEAEVSATDDDTVRRVEVTVARGEDTEPLARMTGYVPVAEVRAGAQPSSGERP